MEAHKNAVAKIAASIKQFYQRKEPYRIFHGSTNSTRPVHKDRVVDISKFKNVLSVDTKRRTALVQPNVPMDRLVESTLKYGLVPPVVMEFPGITAGGGYAGTSGESSSFKHGFFNDTISFAEMVLANGEVVQASATENPDLFHGAAGAVGSLGLTTLIELQLVEAKKFVKVTYHPRPNVAETIRLLQEETANPSIDYLDGILFSKNHGVVVTGEMTDDKPETAHVQTFSRPGDPWFYLHVQTKTRSQPEPVTEYIPLAEYLFRYDRGGFWVGRSAFAYCKFPFNRFTRRFLDDFLHTRMLYKALHASGESNRYIIQDLGLPFSTAERFIDYTSDKFGIWPLWLCPLKQQSSPRRSTFHPHTTKQIDADATHMLNIGLWGFGPSDPAAFFAVNRDLELRLRDLGGMKWLYAHTYYTESEFWDIYDDGRESYEGLRRKYLATTLPSVYDKVKVKTTPDNHRSWTSIWPLGGVWGLWKAIQSKEYLKHRRSTWKWREIVDQ